MVWTVKCGLLWANIITSIFTIVVLNIKNKLNFLGFLFFWMFRFSFRPDSMANKVFQIRGETSQSYYITSCHLITLGKVSNHWEAYSDDRTSMTVWCLAKWSKINNPNLKVVSIGTNPTFKVKLAPHEYVPTIPPLSPYVIIRKVPEYC